MLSLAPSLRHLKVIRVGLCWTLTFQPKVYVEIYKIKQFKLWCSSFAGNYLIRLKAIGQCDNLGIQQFAILTYYTAIEKPHLAFEDVVVNESLMADKFPNGLVSK